MYPCVQHFCFHVCPLYFHLFNLCKFCPVVQYCLRISFLASNCHLHFCNYLHLLGLCAAAPFTCLRVSYFVFHFSFPGMRISVVCLYPSDDVQRFISEIFQRFQCQSLTTQEFDVSTAVEICEKIFIFFESFIIHEVWI